MAQEQDTPKPANNDEIEPLDEELLEEVSGGICSIASCTSVNP